jgi:hypothetical protein
MGLLDDAIRDHLELKRQHGADPGEVARQEHEALGPVRREAAESPGDAVEDERGAELEPDEYDPQPDDHIAETTDEEEPLYDEDLLEGEDERPRRDEDEPGGSVSMSRGTEDPEIAAPRDEPREPPRHDAAPPPGDDPAAEDVLEETPEFLQETPEHDRLWFEQKPPRDFDF